MIPSAMKEAKIAKQITPMIARFLNDALVP